MSQKIAQLYCEEILHIQTQIASEDGSYIIETKMTLSTYLPNSMMSSLLLQGLPGNSSCTRYQLRILKSSTIRLLSAFSGSAGTKAQELPGKQPKVPTHSSPPYKCRGCQMEAKYGQSPHRTASRLLANIRKRLLATQKNLIGLKTKSLLLLVQ